MKVIVEEVMTCYIFQYSKWFLYNKSTKLPLRGHLLVIDCWSITVNAQLFFTDPKAAEHLVTAFAPYGGWRWWWGLERRDWLLLLLPDLLPAAVQDGGGRGARCALLRLPQHLGVSLLVTFARHWREFSISKNLVRISDENSRSITRNPFLFLVPFSKFKIW